MTDRIIVNRRQVLLGSAGLAATPLLAGLPQAHGAAPMLGPARANHYRFTFGDFEVTTLLDGAIQLDGPHPIFGQDQSAEAVQALAEANFLPPTRMEIAFAPVLVNTGEQLILFDAGNGAGRRPNAGHLAELLPAAGYSLDRVDVVVITHCHPDHIGGLMENGQPLLPNARYIISRAEYDFWSPAERAEGDLARVGTLVQSNVVPLAERMTFIEPDQDVVSGITAVDAFGHTPGHMAYHIESQGQRLLLWSDATNHFVASLQRPDWHVRFDMDKDKAGATRRRLLDMAAAERIAVTGYHMPFPAIGYIEKHPDGGYRWVQASYQMNI